MSPAWLTDPKHLLAGALLGFVIVVVVWQRVRPVALLAALALGLVAIAESVVEILEYQVVYGDDHPVTAYIDTIADLANTLIGGAAGIGAAVVFQRRRDRRR